MSSRTNTKKKNTINKEFKVAAKSFWNIVAKYNFLRSEQALLLGIKENRGRLKKYQMVKEIPENDDVILRVGILLRIHKNLRILFPYNRDLVYKWMKTKNSDFQNMSPIEFIADSKIGESLKRLAMVRSYLDCIRCGGY